MYIFWKQKIIEISSHNYYIYETCLKVCSLKYNELVFAPVLADKSGFWQRRHFLSSLHPSIRSKYNLDLEIMGTSIRQLDEGLPLVRAFRVRCIGCPLWVCSFFHSGTVHKLRTTPKMYFTCNTKSDWRKWNKKRNYFFEIGGANAFYECDVMQCKTPYCLRGNIGPSPGSVVVGNS